MNWTFARLDILYTPVKTFALLYTFARVAIAMTCGMAQNRRMS